ncbi:MAG: hypothetical protein ACFE8Z_00535 [Candidatus Hermodarchaeota archaeon]
MQYTKTHCLGADPDSRVRITTINVDSIRGVSFPDMATVTIENPA